MRRIRSHSLLFFIFFFNDTPTTEIYTLSLHDALPIYGEREVGTERGRGHREREREGQREGAQRERERERERERGVEHVSDEPPG